MLYFSSDFHGDFDRFKATKKLRKTDYLVICGDFGFVWNNSDAEQKLLKKIGKMNFTTLFIEGTHDNIPLLRSYPAEEWNGGIIRRISGNLLYLERGGVFTIDGRTLFAMGGGCSQDVEIMVEGNWWPEEMPTEEEMLVAAQNLRNANLAVDYIVTHESSANINIFLTGSCKGITPLGEFFNHVEKDCAFKRWFFGGIHRDKIIPPRHAAIFKQIISAEE